MSSSISIGTFFTVVKSESFCGYLLDFFRVRVCKVPGRAEQEMAFSQAVIRQIGLEDERDVITIVRYLPLKLQYDQ